MKAVILIFAFLIASGCISHANSVSDVNQSVDPTPTNENVNLINIGQNTYSDYKYDKDLLEKLNAGNERFKQTPDEFKSVDFKNFKYNFGRLKEGEFEKEYSKKYAAGGEQYSFKDAFYTDLTGDSKKEAIVFIVRVSCGGSCDGGAYTIYFYSSDYGKPQLIGEIKTGSIAYGCSLKSFTVKDKKIYVEQFGRCVNDSAKDTDTIYACKFCVKDEVHSVYSIDKNQLKRESADIFETKPVKVMNTPAFISINE